MPTTWSKCGEPQGRPGRKHVTWMRKLTTANEWMHGPDGGVIAGEAPARGHGHDCASGTRELRPNRIGASTSE
eukprot:15475647-Alexandrium_andersonii.AAC.1